MTEMQIVAYAKGDRVRVSGERGTWRVYDPTRASDGSILLFGGDMDPNGVQYFRSVKTERLVAETRKRKG